MVGQRREAIVQNTVVHFDQLWVKSDEPSRRCRESGTQISSRPNKTAARAPFP